jgi:hypothetical protein
MPDTTVEQAIKRLKLAKQAVEKQREREGKALQFQVPELQWDDDMKASRNAASVNGVAIPARPMLSIPKLNQPIQLVLNQEKASHLGVNVSPLNEEADDDTAEVIRDLYRREEQRGGAGSARSWAFDRAVKAGTGAYAIDTCYDEESSNPYDQRVIWRRIYDGGLVYFDPVVQEADPSEMEYAFELRWMRHSKLKREFKNSTLAAMADSELKGLAVNEPDWVQYGDANDEPMVLVAVYWRKEYTEKTWVILNDGSFSYADEIPEGKTRHPDPKFNQRTRSVQVPNVVRSLICCNEELEDPEDWNGAYIPLIPTLGVELQPFDGDRRVQGVIEPAMGAQKLFNWCASSAVEIVATETKAPWVMAEGQDEGYEAMWQQAAVRSFPALKYRPVRADNGELLPMPQRVQGDVSRLAPSLELLNQAGQFIQAATTTIDQTQIEQMGRRRVAHQTISALQEQSDLGNSHYLHNLASISMPYEAKVVLDLIPRIYDRPGRVARLLDLEDNSRAVMLNQPFTLDAKKRPQPAPEGETQDHVKHYDLTKGKYSVAVTIGKSWQTRLQQGADELGELLKDPAMMTLIGPVYMKFRDFPGSKEAAEVLKRWRAMQFPGIDQDPNDPQAKQDAAQLAQENQMLKAQLQEMSKALETDKIKTESNEVIAHAKLEADLLKSREANETKIAVAELSAKVKDMELFLEERARLGKDAHETALATAAAGHDEVMADKAHQQAQELAAQQAAQGMAAAEQGQAHTLESQQQAADLAPEPEAGA